MKSSFLVAAALSACALDPSWAQPRFDPSRPFAGITAPDQWVSQFQTRKPELDANDRFGNLTTREWVDAWTKRPYGLSNEDYLKSHSGSGGTGVKIASPYPYKSAAEHYDAWLRAANGGIKPTRQNLPDWSGDWQGIAR